MKRYGCIGKVLVHSFSKEIHARLADYDYELMELSEDELPTFFAARDFAAINVTIPYKERVIPFLNEIDEFAVRVGAVNTVVNRNGKLTGYNTDYYGMTALILRMGLNFRGKKVLILGSGGTAKCARAVAEDLGAKDILTLSRTKKEGCITYIEAKTHHADAAFLINTTPVGMYPNINACPVDIDDFPRLEGVVDAVYNPLSTRLVSTAKAHGIKAECGLFMLVAQAVRAAELFLGTNFEACVAENVFAALLASKENVVLIGMPGCGKSTVGRLLDLNGFRFVDTDTEVEKRCGCSISELIKTKGEDVFRNLESDVIREVGAQSAHIISTGGGAILREENVRALKQNGRLFFLDAPLSRLQATSDRPLSDTSEKLAKLYEQRRPVYLACADVTVPDFATPKETADYILSKRTETLL
ncbi:MAG: shikimate dehydrogenase [Clostridia bacterium]|nr:shikimate dehydrogenase [Clostridia bacterium]